MKAKLTKGISWQSPELLAAGESKARELGMSFSAYVCHLVRKDLGMKGVFSQEATSVIAPEKKESLTATQMAREALEKRNRLKATSEAPEPKAAHKAGKRA